MFVCLLEEVLVSMSPNLGKNILVILNRPYCPIINITTNETIAKLNCIIRGTYPILYKDVSNNEKIINFANDFLLNNQIINKKASFIYLSGLQESNNGTTEQMRVINIGDYYKFKKEEEKDKINRSMEL